MYVCVFVRIGVWLDYWVYIYLYEVQLYPRREKIDDMGI